MGARIPAPGPEPVPRHGADSPGAPVEVFDGVEGVEERIEKRVETLLQQLAELERIMATCEETMERLNARFAGPGATRR